MEHKMLQVLKSCKNVRELKQSHLQIFVHGLQESNRVLAKLIALSSVLYSLDYSVRVFENSHHPNVFVYNTMIECLTGMARQKDGLYTYNRMKACSISPNSYTFTFLLRSCESFEALECGRGLHNDVVKSGFGSCVFVQNTLLDFYSKCSQNFDSACRVFDEMPERDVVSWNSLIGVYMAHGEIEYAIKLFNSMPERNTVSWNSVIAGLSRAGDMESAQSVFKGMPQRSEVSWNAMISGYVRQGDMRIAWSIFEQMPEKTIVSWTAIISGYTKIGDLITARYLFNQMPVKNVVSWNAMIAGYVHNRWFDEALEMFHHMLISGECRPNEATLVSILSACAHLGSLPHGKWIHWYVKKNKFDLSVSLGNAIIDMFSKCGDVESAKTVFHQMTKRCIITWSTMVSGLAMNGECREALDLFDRLCSEGVELDDVIFIAVLAACAHGGLIEEGKCVFKQMLQDFGIEPRIEHYGCMVDLLGRAGKLEEALNFVMSMPLKPNAVIWASLLGSCKYHRNEELVEIVTQKILKLDPSNPGYLMLISNSNASNGQWGTVLSLRTAMREGGIEKLPGCSSIQVANNVHEFLIKDTKHMQRKEIYETLDCLTDHLKASVNFP